jgi:hypothetical protein
MKAIKGKKKVTKETKEPWNIFIKPTVKKLAIDLAYARKISPSELIEIMIYDYNAE